MLHRMLPGCAPIWSRFSRTGGEARCTLALEFIGLWGASAPLLLAVRIFKTGQKFNERAAILIKSRHNREFTICLYWGQLWGHRHYLTFHSPLIFRPRSYVVTKRWITKGNVGHVLSSCTSYAVKPNLFIIICNSDIPYS